jgi:hypothetical protein
MAYWNGTQIVYESFDYMIWAQNDALNGKATQVSSIPAAYQSSYSTGFTYGSNELKKHGKQDKL